MVLFTPWRTKTGYPWHKRIGERGGAGKKMKSGSNLEKVLSNGDFAVTVEIGPPMDCNAEVVVNKARMLKGYTDAFNITDNQTAVVRLSSIASAILIMREGLEPVIQMTCRDRNRLAIQSDILGAAALGV